MSLIEIPNAETLLESNKIPDSFFSELTKRRRDNLIGEQEIKIGRVNQEDPVEFQIGESDAHGRHQARAVYLFTYHSSSL